MLMPIRLSKTILQLALIILFSTILLSCELTDEPERYKGYWVTHRGECRNHGTIVVDIDRPTRKTEATFFCLSKVCKIVNGQLKMGDYLDFSPPLDEMMEGGFVTNTDIMGSWEMDIGNQGLCIGTYRAERIR